MEIHAREHVSFGESIWIHVRKLTFLIALVSAWMILCNTAFADDADAWATEGRGDGGDKTANIEARDTNRVPGYGHIVTHKSLKKFL